MVYHNNKSYAVAYWLVYKIPVPGERVGETLIQVFIDEFNKTTKYILLKF